MPSAVRKFCIGLLFVLAGCTQHGEEQEQSTLTSQDPSQSSPTTQNVPHQGHDRRRQALARDLQINEYPGGAFIITDFGLPPPGDAATAIAGLKAIAKSGNARASYEIYLKINQCLNALNDYRAQQTRDSDAKTLRNCESLAPEDYSTASEWLLLAAEQGSLGAQLLYASDPEAAIGDASAMLSNPAAIEEYKERSNRYLVEAAAQGSVDALSALGDTYMNGIMAKQNLPLSYAYFLAMKRIDSQLVSGRKTEFFESELSPSQLTEANKKSMEIYDECCAGKAR